MNPVRRERSEQVRALIADLRSLQRQHPAHAPAFRQQVSHQLAALAARPGLWSLDDFPIPDHQRWGVYQLHEEADGTLALYASAARPGHAQPPHDHTTWACIAGVSGIERNRHYRREGPGRGPGAARLTCTTTQDIGAGDTCFLLADDIHDIEVMPPGDAMHLHLYGRGLPHLDRRLRFDLDQGACDYFPAFTGIPVFDLTP